MISRPIRRSSLRLLFLSNHKMNFSRFQKLNSKIRFIQCIWTPFIFTNFSIQGSTDRIVLNLHSTVHQGQQQSQQFHQKQPKYNHFWTFTSLWSSRTFLEFYQSSNYLGDIFCKVEEVPRNISDLLTTCF